MIALREIAAGVSFSVRVQPRASRTAIAGVLGIGFGLWWADAAAAIVISGEVVHDGVSHLKLATYYILDHWPRTVEGNGPDRLRGRVLRPESPQAVSGD